jgi:ABC-type uncharacterized transport system permease subunit
MPLLAVPRWPSSVSRRASTFEAYAAMFTGALGACWDYPSIAKYALVAIDWVSALVFASINIGAEGRMILGARLPPAFRLTRIARWLWCRWR